MAVLVLKHFRCEVVRRSTDCLLALTFVIYLSSEAKVTDFKLHTLGKEEVAQLEVTVNDLALVDIFHTFNELLDVVASFELVEALTTTNQIRKRLVVADIEHNINVVFVFEVAIKAYDVLVGQ